MTSPTRTDLTSRESVLMLLSDAETARVSTAEGNGSEPPRLLRRLFGLSQAAILAGSSILR